MNIHEGKDQVVSLFTILTDDNLQALINDKRSPPSISSSMMNCGSLSRHSGWSLA